jgi:hypothetical protein
VFIVTIVTFTTIAVVGFLGYSDEAIVRVDTITTDVRLHAFNTYRMAEHIFIKFGWLSSPFFLFRFFSAPELHLAICLCHCLSYCDAHTFIETSIATNYSSPILYLLLQLSYDAQHNYDRKLLQVDDIKVLVRSCLSETFVLQECLLALNLIEAERYEVTPLHSLVN